MLAALAAAGCVPRPVAPPAPRSAPPAPVARYAAPPPQAPDWRDIPLTPGGWTYEQTSGGSEARFGPSAGSPLLVVRCDRAGAAIVLSRVGAATGPMLRVRTSFTARTLAAAVETMPRQGSAARLPASDPILDSMAFSRGRFTVEAAGLPTLVVPAWPEPARVIEDCRAGPPPGD